jgi:hypothetical protein
MAQTAVENIIEKLKEQIRKSAHNKLGTNRTGDYRIGLIKAIGLCVQAKEMEKQQIIDAVNLPKENRWYDAKLYNSSGEQYFNQIFKKD